MSDSINVKDLKIRMEKVIEAFRHELAGLRTGRASVNLLEPIHVEAYGSMVPLNQVANVSVPEARMLSVSVWDKSMVSAVERAIRDSKLGINPIVEGTNLRLPLPPLTAERRKELVKIAQQYAEHGRVAVRHVRRDGMDLLKKAEKNSEISQDDSHVIAEKIQKTTDDMIAIIDKFLEEKSKEIMQV